MAPALARRTPQQPKEEGRPKRQAVLNKKETPGAPKKRGETKKVEPKKAEPKKTGKAKAKKKPEPKKKSPSAKKNAAKAKSKGSKGRTSGNESDTHSKSAHSEAEKKDSEKETEEEVEEEHPNIVELEENEKKNATDSQEEESEEGSVHDDGEVEDDEDSDFDPDDDPDKLWCFCKKPHSNRFMICCDTCEEWFHGDCVGISMAKGREMEKTGEEWCCNQCKKNAANPPDQNPVPIKSPLNSPLKKTVSKQIDPTSLTKARSLSLDSMKSNLAKSLKDRSLSLSAPEVKEDNIKEEGEESSLQNESLADDKKSTPVKSKQPNEKSKRRDSVEKVKVEIPGFTFDHIPTKKEEKPEKLEKIHRKRYLHRRDSASHDDEAKRKRQEELKALAKAKVRTGGAKTTEIVKECRRGECNRPAMKGSIYCSRECIYKYANETIKLLEDERKKSVLTVKSPDPKTEHSKGSTIISPATSSTDRVMETTQERIAVFEKTTGKIVAGVMAPTKKYLFSWLEEHPTYEVLKPGKQPTEIKGYKRDQDEVVRSNVRKSLKDILISRCKSTETAINIEAVGKLCKKIETELLKLFGETGQKYKTKYRSLIFNLKDMQNKILYKRVVSGEISPHKLVHMTPEQLATPELARWREQESKHNIEMIKKRELEEAELQKYPSIKKTHKGEVEIEGDENLETLEIKADSAPDRRLSSTSSATNEMNDLLKDTTEEHAHHLFDSNCKICTGKMMPPGESQTTGVSTTIVEAVAESSVPSPTEDDMLIGSPPSPDTSALSPSSPNPVSIIAPPPSARKQPSVWRGFVMMQKVAKFVCTAYAVSGTCENLMEILPDTVHVCGRIPPGQVWEYLSQMKEGRKNQNKFIDVIRFEMSSNEEKQGYIKLYTYFYTRQRIGVVGNCYSGVKDMYILPLASHDPIPPELTPLPGLPKPRPHMLLGIIVRVKSAKKKHSDTVSADSSPEMVPKKKKKKKERKKEKELEKERVEIEAQKKLIDIIFKNRVGDPEHPVNSLAKDIDPATVLKNLQEKDPSTVTTNVQQEKEASEKKTEEDFSVNEEENKKLEMEQLKKLKEQQEEIYRLQLEVGTSAQQESDVVIMPDPATMTNDDDVPKDENVSEKKKDESSLGEIDSQVTAESPPTSPRPEEPVADKNEIPLLGGTDSVSYGKPVVVVTSSAAIVTTSTRQASDDDYVMNLIEDIQVSVQPPKFPLDIVKNRAENKMPELPVISLPTTSVFGGLPLPLPGSIPKVPIPPNIKLPPGVPFPPLPPKPISLSGPVPAGGSISNTPLSPPHETVRKSRDPRNTSPHYDTTRRDPRLSSPYKDMRRSATSPSFDQTRGEPSLPPQSRRGSSPEYDHTRHQMHHPEKNPYRDYSEERRHGMQCSPPRDGGRHRMQRSPRRDNPSYEGGNRHSSDAPHPVDHRQLPPRELYRTGTETVDTFRPESNFVPPGHDAYPNKGYGPPGHVTNFNVDQTRPMNTDSQRLVNQDQPRAYYPEPQHPGQQRQFHTESPGAFHPDQQRPFHPDGIIRPFHTDQQGPPHPMENQFGGREVVNNANVNEPFQHRMSFERSLQSDIPMQPRYQDSLPRPPGFVIPPNQQQPLPPFYQGVHGNNATDLHPSVASQNFPPGLNNGAVNFNNPNMPPFAPTLANFSQSVNTFSPQNQNAFPSPHEMSGPRPPFPFNSGTPFQPPMQAPGFPPALPMQPPDRNQFQPMMPSFPPHSMQEPGVSKSLQPQANNMGLNEALSQKGLAPCESQPRSLLEGMKGFEKYDHRNENRNETRYKYPDRGRSKQGRGEFDRRDRDRKYSDRKPYRDNYRKDDYNEYKYRPSPKEERLLPPRERLNKDFSQDAKINPDTRFNRNIPSGGRKPSDDLEEGEVRDHDNKTTVGEGVFTSRNMTPPRVEDEQDVWQTRGRYKQWGRE